MSNNNSCYSGLIISGCSFSAGTSDLETAKLAPTVWSHFLLQSNPNITQFVNLAIPGAGNLAISTNLISFLQSQNYPSDKNQIIFNISGFDRLDVLVPHNHYAANDHFSYDQILNYGWITSGGFTRFIKTNSVVTTLHKNMTLEGIVHINCIAIISLISYLECNDYNYRFMLMQDRCLEFCPQWFINFLTSKKHRWITLDGFNLFEYCKHNNFLDIDDFHPNITGHQMIAQQVQQHIINNK